MIRLIFCFSRISTFDLSTYRTLYYDFLVKGLKAFLPKSKVPLHKPQGKETIHSLLDSIGFIGIGLLVGYRITHFPHPFYSA